MKYKAVIFDLDGTILDTLEDLHDSINYVLRLHCFRERSIDEIRRFVGNGIRTLIKCSAPENTEETLIDTMFIEFTEWYKKHCAVKTAPYPGIVEVINIIRENGAKTAVVSNKGDYAVRELVDIFFDGLFDKAVGERDGIRKKPAPDSVNEVLEKLGFDAKDAVYIGDSEVDILTAENVGIDCISVTWGFRDKEYLAENGGKIFASTPYELLEILS